MKGKTQCTLAMVASLSLCVPGVARAQQAAARIDTTSQAAGPSMAMVDSGLTTFGLAYVPAVFVDLTSTLPADHTLIVPLAGPWIDLTQRRNCSPATSCNAENTDKVLLVTDGLFQAIGALTVVGGFLAPVAVETGSVRIAPARIGGRAYGLVAVGKF
jgi:hypothetical protein